MGNFKSHIKKITPNFLILWRQRLLARKALKPFRNLSNARETFTQIYEGAHWGQSSVQGDPYHSGGGSHRAEVVGCYVAAVSSFLRSFKEKPDVVDLGCGDFAVGSQIRALCGRYVAVDVVDGLIERNKGKFSEMNVEFKTLDLIQDDLPSGEVAFIRQVLQHLSNNDIKQIAAKLAAKYRFVVVSEHVPAIRDFVPNLDQLRGPDIRLSIGKVGSGVVLTDQPFNLEVKESTVLCEAPQDMDDRKAVIRTSLYRLN